ncbi:MAG: hypothetical protein ACE5DX_03920 [Candidatus Dojkabacteria bacterium]
MNTRKLSKAKSLIAALVLLGLFAVPAAAQNVTTRDTIDFSSRIVDENASAIPDGQYEMKFLIYDAQTGGNLLWSEQRQVTTRRGSFSIDLGAEVIFPKGILADVSNLFLHICLDFNGVTGDGTGICAPRYEENFGKRKRLNSVPWALRSFALGPVSIADGQTAYEIDATSTGTGNIFNFSFNGATRFNLATSGDLTLTDGTSSFSFLPGQSRINLPVAADIFFGSSSLKNTAEGTSGGALIGVYEGNFTNVTGSNVQEVLESIDDEVGGGGGGPETDPIWVAARDTAATTITPDWTYDGTINSSDILPQTDGTSNLGSIALRYNEGYYDSLVNIGSDVNTTPGKSMLNIDNDNQVPTGGAYDQVAVWSEYDPTGGSGTDQYNALYIDSEILPGDGTAQARQRGIRLNMNNNSLGTVAQMYGLSTTLTNNGTVDYLYGGYDRITNSGTVNIDTHAAMSAAQNNSITTGNFMGYVGWVVNSGTVSGRLGSYGFYVTNNGTYDGADTRHTQIRYDNAVGATTSQYYGVINEHNNDGTALGGFNSMWSHSKNGATGTIAAGMNTTVSLSTNFGTITGDSSNVWLLSEPGTVVGDYYGINNVIGNQGTSTTNPTANNFYGIRNYFDSDPADHLSANDSIYGVYNDITGDLEAGVAPGEGIYGLYQLLDFSGNTDQVYGIYNEVIPSGSYTDIVGLYSTDGTTATYLNSGSLSGNSYGVDTDGIVATDLGIEFNADTDDMLSTTNTGVQATDDLYYGNDIICDVSAVNCGMGGGGGSLWTDSGLGDIYYDSGYVSVGTTDIVAPLTVGEDGGMSASIYGDVTIDGQVSIGSTAPISPYSHLTIDRSFSTGDAAHINFQNSWHTGDPASIFEGDLWYNPTSGALNFYDGASTTNLLSGGGGGGLWTDAGAGDIYYNSGSVVVGAAVHNGEQLEVEGDAAIHDGYFSWDFDDVYFDPFGTLYFSQFNAYDSNFGGDVYFDNDYLDFSSGDVYWDSTLGEYYFAQMSAGDTHFGGDLYIDSDYFEFNFGDFYWDPGVFEYYYAQNGGDNFFGGNMYIQDGYLCVDDGSFSCPAGTSGEVYGRFAYGTFDVAENIYAESNVEAGDIVSIVGGVSETVGKTHSSYQADVLGVISTDPGITGGYSLEEKNGYNILPIALAGRVQVRVNLENGPISIGDPVTTSSTAGEGMKATDSGRIIGFAMENFTAKSETQTVLVYLDTGYYQTDTPQADNSGSTTGKLESGGKAAIAAGSSLVVIEADGVNADSLIMLTPTSSTFGQQLYVSSQDNDEFVVQLDQRAKVDISFSYVIF